MADTGRSAGSPRREAAELLGSVGLGGVEIPPVTGEDPALPSVFRVGTAAAACVGAALAAAADLWLRRGGRPGEVRVAVREAAISFRSERYLRMDGAGAGAELWDRVTGDYRAGDGRWVRLHCNYSHHRLAAMRALGAAADRASAAAAVAALPAAGGGDRVVSAGGCAAAMRSPEEWARHPQGQAVAGLPLVSIQRRPGVPARPLPAAARPLAGVRVLDLTRVIAGPVCGRTLAALGADVLRVGADHLPDAERLVVDTGFGKRSCHLDLRTGEGRGELAALVRECDVFVQGYRPGAIAGLGFGPEAIAELRPGAIAVSLSAYGGSGPWGSRRGFDSLVQMASGIAWEGAAAAGVDEPRPLPAQALDHATGWLAALGAIAALRRRAEEGGSWTVEVSLARTARWLDGLGRVDGLGVPDPAAEDVVDLLALTDSPFGRVTHVRPPGSIGDAEPRWESPPHRPGQDPAGWW